MIREHTCCFTGGRPQHIGFDRTDILALSILKRSIEEAVHRAFEDGYTDFICGMSSGFDLWAGETVMQMQNNLPIRLHAAIPFRDQSAGWGPEWVTMYENVLRGCCDRFTLSEKYHHGCYHERNRFMVDNSSRVIAWNLGRIGGGTDYTCRYAKKNGVEIVNLADPQLSLY